MKLLFDQNLSPNLINRLADLFPGSTHVYLVGLDRALDLAVWQYAHENDYTIVTRDADFSELSLVLGYPPKIIWIRRGNCSTQEIEAILRRHYTAIIELDGDPNSGVLTLF